MRTYEQDYVKPMSEEDLEVFLEDLTPDELEDDVYTSIGSIDKGFINVYLSTWDYGGDEIGATLSTDEYGSWTCKGFKEYSYDRWVTTLWYSWEKE